MEDKPNVQMLLTLLDTWSWMAMHGASDEIKQSGRQKIINAFGSIQAAVDFKKHYDKSVETERAE